MIMISSSSGIRVGCTRCGATLAMINVEPVERLAVLDAGSETMRQAALHGLVCGKPPEAVSALTDALRAVTASVAGGGR